MPLRRLFALTSVAFLVVLAISPAKNALRPYRSLQRKFAALGVARAHSAQQAREYAARPVAIHQIWLPALDQRVDRCTTCHLGVADAVMKGAPPPFALHPWTPHAPGQIDRFGCTSCHEGQGPATSEGQAHGTAGGRRSSAAAGRVRRGGLRPLSRDARSSATPRCSRAAGR